MRILFSLLLCHTIIYSIAQKMSLETVVQKGHNAAVKAIDISPNGKYLVTGSRDKSAKLWDKVSGKELRTFTGHGHTINGICFSKDGKYIATSSADNTAKLWEVSTGKEVFSTPTEAKYMTDVTLSPNGKFLISAGYNNTAKIWNIESKQLLKEIEVNADQGSGYGIRLDFSPNGQWLAIGEDNKTVKVYDVNSWSLTYTLAPAEGWCGGCGTLVNFSSDSKYLLKLSHNSMVEKYDLSSGKRQQSYGEEFDDIAAVAFDGENKTVMAASKKDIYIWDNANGSLLHQYHFEQEITEVIFDDSTHQLLASSSNNTAFSISIETGEIIKTYTGILNDVDKGGIHYDPDNYWDSYIAKYIRLKNKVLISPDGKTLLKGKFGTIAKRWDIATGETIKEYQGHSKAVICYDYDQEGKHLITGDGSGEFIYWDMAGKPLQKIKAHREPLFEVKLHPNGTETAVSTWDGYVSIWDLEKGTQTSLLDMQNYSAYSLSYTPDGLYLVTGKLNKSLDLWEPDSKTIVRTFVGHTDIVSSISFGTDPQLMLTSSWDGTARIWDIHSGMMVQKFKGHTGALHAAIYSTDGKFIFTAGDDRVIRMWDISNAKTIKTFEGHQAEITSLNISKDGKTLLSGSLDGVIKLWNLDKGTEFYEHIHVGKNDWMAKTKDGYFNATEGARHAIHFVKGMEYYNVDQFFEDFYRPDLLPSMYKNRGATGQLPNIDSKLTSSPPPLLKINSLPVQGTHEIDLYVKIMDEGGGVSELRMSHNGKQLTLDTEKLSFPNEKGKYTVYTQRIALVGGHNTISVSGLSKGRVESTPVEIKLTATSSEKSSTCYVVAIGIDKYKNNKLTLNYAHEDAEAFVKTIEEHSQKLFSKIEVHTLFDEQATKSNILLTLDELKTKVQANDVLLFYYAGHGSMVDNRFFFIPQECTRLYEMASLVHDGIEATLIQEKLKQIKALKQIIIMDACQSGSSVELLALRGANEEKAIAQLSRSAGIHVLASAGGEQYAKELSDLGHGLFTYVLLSALSGKADGAPKDGKITVYELKSYLDDQVPELNQQYSGKPQYPYTFSRGHDFPIVME